MVRRLGSQVVSQCVQISGKKVQRKGAFEVYFDNELVYSKIASKELPDLDAMADHVERIVTRNGDIQPITETDGCMSCRYQGCCYVS